MNINQLMFVSVFSLIVPVLEHSETASQKLVTDLQRDNLSFERDTRKLQYVTVPDIIHLNVMHILHEANLDYLAHAVPPAGRSAYSNI